MFDPEGPTFLELARQALSSVEEGYDLLAPKFDRTPYRTPEEILRPTLAAAGGPESVDDAMDLCCGTGAALWHLRAMCRRECVGVDLSPGNIQRAVAMAESRPDLRLSFINGACVCVCACACVCPLAVICSYKLISPVGE